MLPVVSPWHSTFTWDAAKLNENCGWVIVTLSVTVHPFASVTTTVYVPDAIFVKSWLTALLLHKYVYGAVPPLTVKSILPVAFPLHNTFTCVVINAKATAGWVIVTDIVSVQPFVSVTTTVYVPIPMFCKSCVVAPVFHAYVYGDVPPVGVKLMLPVVSPWHSTFTWDVAKVSGNCGCVIVRVMESIHPFASVTITS